jgi:hypothetical protein
LYNKSIPKYRSKVNFAGILLSSPWIRILIVFTASVIYCEPNVIRWNQFPWFLIMQWSMASWIRGIKLYGHFVWFKWTVKSAKIRTPRLIMISQYDFGPIIKKSSANCDVIYLMKSYVLNILWIDTVWTEICFTNSDLQE